MELEFLTVDQLVDNGVIACASKSIVRERDASGKITMHNGPTIEASELKTILKDTYGIVCGCKVPIKVGNTDGTMYLFVQDAKGRARISCVNAQSINGGTTHKFAGIWWRSFNAGNRQERINANLSFAHLLLPNEVIEACYTHAATEFGLKGGAVSDEALEADI